ncbi:unnamed protein product [Mycena citricolor]|uniref:Snf7-domain-containing protein n=1 Tax=Mycena citricolor TaxID=2018698 RepID=A0AAD2K6G9_9AGAR|nr:unnamed protein product [Mycena citricolor]
MHTPSKAAPANPALLRLGPYASASSSRLQSLYADISRQKHSNPVAYRANVEWWRGTLEAVTRAGLGSGSRLVLSANARLMDLLRYPGAGKPLALPTAIAELRTQKVLLTKAEFLSAAKSVYDPGWLPVRIAAFVVGKPLWWALEQLGVVGEEGMISSASSSSGGRDTSWWDDYVLLPLIEEVADAVLVRQSLTPGDASDVLYSFESFKATFSDVLGDDAPLGDEDVKIVLKFLQRDRKCIVIDEQVIKFVGTGSPSEITAVDRGILELMEAVQHLQAQVDQLQGSIDQYTQKATTAVQQKHKSVALTYLRQRKQLEELLQKRLGSLETLDGTLLRVKTAASDIEIIKSYESSSTTLRAILSHPSLQRDSIEKTMDAMAEANADAREIDEAIRIGSNVALGVDESAFDEDELAQELQRLASEVEAEKVDDVERMLNKSSLATPVTPPREEEEQKIPQAA